MSTKGLLNCQNKMKSVGVDPVAIRVFTHYYHQLESGETGLIPEETITPLTSVPNLDEFSFSQEQQRDALSKTVMIKLNGGLGTSMGLDAAKSLLPVRQGNSFLDLICQQVLAARKEYGVDLPLIFMDSFRTQSDTLEALAKYPDIKVDGLPLDFLQNQEPKVRADDLEPVEWPPNPELEWCPPGHGDIYPALLGTGILKKLLDAGYRYAMTSNADNLGATPDPLLAAWFANSGASYAPEVCLRTPTDRKGGHLAIRKSDGQLILRDTAQTPADQMDFFTDEHRHPFFHTNNLWFDLQTLYDLLTERDGVLGLPLIPNEKTVDPTDSSSPKVIQIECAMGAAVEVFPAAQAVLVPRRRFLPVKTTAELLLVRSDLYELDEMSHLVKVAEVSPDIKLDSRYYKTINAFESRFANGVPSLRNASSLEVKGDWIFEAGASVSGQGALAEDGTAKGVTGAVLHHC